MKSTNLAALTLLIQLSACAASPSEAGAISKTCRNEIDALGKANAGMSDRHRLAAFETISEECRSYPDVKILHAKHLTYEGMSAAALAVVESIDAPTAKQEKEIFRIRFAIASSDGNVEEGAKIGKAMIEKYPDYFFGYTVLGRVQAAAKNDRAAIELYEKAESLVKPGEEEDAARALAIASASYYNEGNSRKALTLVESAIEYDPGFLSDATFAAVGASSALELDQIDKAEAMLIESRRLNPGVVQDAQFKAAFDYVDKTRQARSR